MKTQSSGQTLESMLQRYCAQAGSQLQAVCSHALSGGGRTRAKLLLQASEREDRISVQAACALEMMHAATLLQDDIFDRSSERRGRRAAYLQFGEAQAVLASDWLLLRSLEIAMEVHPIFFQQLACAARNMAATVARELAPPFVSGSAAARLYIEEICQGKTASLFALALHGGALLHADLDPAQALGWAAVGNRIGCTYQFLDDCLDVYAPADAVHKSTGVDLQQGRLTLPLLTALEALQSAKRFISIERFRSASLTRAELETVKCAIAEESTKACLQEEVRRQMQNVEENARTAGVPCEAITAALSDMETKVALCFGERTRCLVFDAAQHESLLIV